MKTNLILCLVFVVLVGALFIPDCNAGIIYPKAPDGGEQAVSNLLDSRFLKPF